MARAGYTVRVHTEQPGLLTPVANFLIGGTFVLPPGSIAGRSTREAKPGETIVLYGIGFGRVTPASSPGQIVSGQNQLTQPLAITFGNVPGTLAYDGLARPTWAYTSST